jgi:hypothetical protein
MNAATFIFPALGRMPPHARFYWIRDARFLVLAEFWLRGACKMPWAASAVCRIMQQMAGIFSVGIVRLQAVTSLCRIFSAWHSICINDTGIFAFPAGMSSVGIRLYVTCARQRKMQRLPCSCIDKEGAADPVKVDT